MTLCMAWIRKKDLEEELVMATDSRLTGGESWDSGVKLFELPRLDCLLCFAGATSRAYPLILNSISSIKFDSNLASPHTDIHPTFLGRQLSEHDMPPVRFYDPDLATILDDALPENINEIDKDLYGDEYEFMVKCYPECRLKAELSSRERKKLRKLIQSVAYRKYCSDQLGAREVADE